MSQNEQLQFICETSWDKVAQVWRAREEDVWRAHYESRGWRSWLAWRMHYMGQFAPQMRRWSLYRVIDPLTTIPDFRVGAFRGWKQYYPSDQHEATFTDVAQHPTLLENYAVTRLLAEDFSADRQIIGFRSGDKLVIRDGTHHCAAIALAARLGCRVEAPTLLAFTDFEASEADLFRKAYDQRFAPQPQR